NHLGEELLGPTLIAYGTPEQQKRFLPRILDVTELWSQGYSEPESGSDLASLRSTATKTDGGWLLNGQKIWSSRAVFGERAFG
ncbi:acyl-CoA dehydrogenase, partial [Mycobacterium sp. ITM-2017-0098]